MKELENMVTSIRDDLNRLYEADYTDEEREEMEQDGEAYDIYSYFSAALDIEYTIGTSGDFRGARIAVALGGPNIYVDTRRGYVEGFRGCDHYESWIPSEVCDEINTIFEDYYELSRS